MAGAPRLAEGIELIGELEGSGYKETPYVARRPDGQMIQMTYLLHLIAEQVDGKSDYRAIAERVSERFGRRVSANNVGFLIEKKLRPLGVVAAADGSQPQVKKGDPLLALKFKTVLIPERAVNVIAAMLRPLFWPPAIVAALVGLVALDIWYFSVHGVGQSLRDTLYQPALILLIYGLLLVSIAWHELGHATACRYGGATPGVIGFGIYVVWPAFYNDVTDAYRLDKGGRVRVDLGGIYFNVLFTLGVAGAYFVTGFEPLLVLILVQHLLMLYQFMPFLRLDGYYVIADLTGVPDLFARVKPTLRSALPWKETEDSVAELKPWVRVVVTAWVLTVIPLLLYAFAMMVISAPRVFATGWDSLVVQQDRFTAAIGGERYTEAAAGGLQMAMLVLPLGGMTVTFSRVTKRLYDGAMNVTDGRPILRGLTYLTATGAAVFAAFVLWPNGEYRPIQEGERWTVTSSFEALEGVTTGRPSLTPEHEDELGGATSVREPEGGAATPTPTATPSAGSEPVDDATPTPEEETVSPSPTEPTPTTSPAA